MIAQNIIPTDVVMSSDDATVRAAVRLLTSNQPAMVYRWACETCGLVHTGPLPTSCDSCGSASLMHLSDFRREMNSRW